MSDLGNVIPFAKRDHRPPDELEPAPSEQTSEGLQEVRVYSSIAYMAMEVLTRLWNSPNPAVREAAGKAISQAVEVTTMKPHDPPPV